MSLRQCDKCNEMVDEAKAFCPGCGHAFVEEQKRQEPSVFDSMERTIELDGTMFNQMLTDMRLNISGAPNKPAEVNEPAVQQAVPPAEQVTQPAVQQVIKPAIQEANRLAQEPAKLSTGGISKWIIIGRAAVLLLLILLIALILVVFALWYSGRI